MLVFIIVDLTPLRIRSDAGFLILIDMELKDIFVKNGELFARFEAPGKAYDYPLAKKIGCIGKKDLMRIIAGKMIEIKELKTKELKMMEDLNILLKFLVEKKINLKRGKEDE